MCWKEEERRARGGKERLWKGEKQLAFKREPPLLCHVTLRWQQAGHHGTEWGAKGKYGARDIRSNNLNGQFQKKKIQTKCHDHLFILLK